MRRTLVVVALVVCALLVNASLVDRQTREAEPRSGGRLVGDVNVRVEGRGPAVILVHGFSASLGWWDRVAPGLARDHRVIRLDLLGHGGSSAPDAGYSIEQQARAVAGVLRQLGIRRAAAVGHSLGGSVVTSLAEQFPGLVSRIALIDSAPSTKSPYASDLGPLARLYVTPVIGQLLARVRSDGAIRRGLERAFAPGHPVPARFVDDVKRLPWPAFRRSRESGDDYRAARSLDARLRRVAKPLLVLWGPADEIAPAAGLERFRSVPGARLASIAGAGHSPIVERPGETLRELRRFLR